MSQDGNSALEVLHETTETEKLRAEIAELKALLQQGAADNVTHPAKFQGEAPKYRLNSSCFLEDDTLHVEGEEIEYLNSPNMEMVPINDAARKRMQEYIDLLTDIAREQAELRGQPFRGLITDKGVMIAQARQDAVRSAQNVSVISMPADKGEVPQMPQHEAAQAQARRRGRPPKSAAVVSSKAPEPVTRHGTMPAPILGTRNAS